MAIKLTTTAESSNFVKMIVYGESGVGKTWLCKTAPKPVIISAEKGLLTLKKEKIPVIEIQTYQDLEDAYDFVTTHPKAKGFQTICLDSISDIAETLLAEEKLTCGADPRQAYGAYADKLLPLIKKFRDIEDKNVYFTAKSRVMKDGMTEVLMYSPSMPGQQLGPQLPYLFDFCFVLRIGLDDDGENFRFLQTQGDLQYVAKARGDALESIERPDLGYIIKKVLSDTVEKASKVKPEKEQKEKKKKIVIEGSFDEEQEQIPDGVKVAEEAGEAEVSEELEEAIEENSEESIDENFDEDETMDAAAESSFEDDSDSDGQ